jgi:C1A family cysteine protease
MKKTFKLLPVLSFLLLTSCFNDYDDNLVKDDIKENLEEESPNDPKETGLAISCTFSGSPLVFSNTTINPNLPQSYDLSPLMPPVRSQGIQGSCVAWATTYYLKSYQEKIQHGYEYSSFSNLMSPAFIYNQIKVSEDCSLGTCIEAALYKLKISGVCTWQSFPYNQSNCSIQPNGSQNSEALNNRISQGYIISSETVINNISYSRESIFKNLISQGIPIIIGMRIDYNFANSTPRNQDNIYIYNTFNPASVKGGHAMLIVGYSNELNAFKVVNSWGTAWGNEGYCWISYNFFKKNNDINFEPGLEGSYMAFDL